MGNLDKQDFVGEVSAACRIARDCLLIFGWLDDPLPLEGVVSLAARADQGRFRAISWPREAPGRSASKWLLAVLRFSDVDALEPGQLAFLHAVGSRKHNIAKLPSELLGMPEFLQQMTPRLGGHAARAVHFLTDSFGAAARGQGPGARFVADLLRAIAKPDGFIEIRGVTSAAALFVQGWSARLPSGEAAVLVETEGLAEHRGHFATFPRTDIAAPATGVVGLVPAFARQDSSSLRRMYYLVGSDYHMIEVYAGGSQLTPADTGGHVKDILPSLRGEAAIVRAFRRATRHRFAGHDTVSSLEVPVRAAVDLAIRLPGVGYYLTGWLLDPLGRVASVALKSTGRVDERLDERWARIQRSDVTQGFMQDPRFAPHLAGNVHRHGFTVFVPAAAEASDDRFFLEFDLGDDACGFMPIDYAQDSPVVLRRKVLNSFDIHKPSAGEIIERHVGPLFLGVREASGARDSKTGRDPAQRRPTVSIRAELGDPHAGRRTAIIMPVAMGETPGLLAQLAQFGVHRLGPDEALHLVLCEPDDGLADMLERHLGFYDIPGHILVPAEPIDFCEALELGAAATRSEELLFLSSSVFVADAEWCAGLREALESDDRVAVVSPTILHEDYSVKFAGVDAVETSDAAPFVSPSVRRAGYPRSWLAGKAAGPTLAGSLECCLFRRAAFEACGGFAEGFALSTLRGIDLFMRLGGAGFICLWTPNVEVYGLGSGSGIAPDAATYWVQTGGVVDGWTFRRTWRHLMTPPGAAGGTITNSATSPVALSSGAR